MGAIEYGLVAALNKGIARGVHWPVILMAVLAALFLALGVLRHYVDIYTHHTVRGISFLFCAIDALGDLTAILSIIFRSHLDTLGIVIYGVELVLWCGIFACGGYFNLPPWIRSRLQARREGKNDQRAPPLDHRSRCQGSSQQIGNLGISLRNDSSTSAFRTASLEDVRSRPGLRLPVLESQASRT